MAVVEVQAPPVAHTDADEVVDCVWFQGKAFVRGKFSADSLEALSSPFSNEKRADRVSYQAA